ncbi:hypothetical protein [Saccharicrinis carchari]|uniref:hypothetical protein n=1 Tax=Saccharicrinis carchari TaxID=1168039 RepID=UPI00163DB191|nr:hypothetical protein [Saccharicrinis carchari]
MVAGVEKDFKVYLIDNQLFAISCVFSKEGLSHENEMNESADFWYFEKVKGNLRLVKKFTMEASKATQFLFSQKQQTIITIKNLLK